MMPSAQFISSIKANVAYWRTKAQLPPEQKVRALDGDRHNLFRATEFGLGLAETWMDTTDLVLECYELIHYRGYSQEWIPVLDRILADCPESRLDIQINLYHQLGNLYRAERQFDQALIMHHSEAELAYNLQDELFIARAHANLSKTNYLLRKYDIAETHALAALTYFRNRDSTLESYASTLNMLGLITQGRGDLSSSQSWFVEGIAVFRKTELPIELGRTLMNYAITLESARKPDEALAYFQEAETLLEPTAYELEKSKIALSMGTLFFNQGDLQKAESAYLRANSPYMRDAGPIYDQAAICNNLGNVYQAQAKLPESEVWLSKSIKLYRQADAHLMLANSLATLSRTLLDQGQIERVKPLYDEAMSIIGEYPDDAFTEMIRSELDQVHNDLLE